MITIKEALKIACLAALLAVLAPLAWLTIRHAPAVVQDLSRASDSLPATMASVKEAADTANLVSTESLDLVGSATKLVDGIGETNHRAGVLIGQLGETEAAATGTIRKVGETVDSARARIDALAVTQAKADDVLDQLATVPPAVTSALAPLPGLETSLTRTSDAAETFLAGPASILATNGATLETSLNTATGHIDARWFAPWDGKHKLLHYGGEVFNIALHGAQGAYWGVGIANGQ